MILIDSFMITPKAKHFIFNCALSPAFEYLAGQFITVHFEHEGKSLKRSYSIANAPKKDNVIEFAASYFEGGPGTEYLFNLKPNDQVETTGPFGRLILKDEAFTPSRYIFIATSTGITPFRAMLQELALRLDQNPDMQAVILQGVQKKEDILYADDFRGFAQKYPQVRFHPCLSRESSENLAEDEYSGYVQHVLPKLNLDQNQDIVYLCGNPGMVDEAFNHLKEHGFTVQQIIREKYISR